MGERGGVGVLLRFDRIRDPDEGPVRRPVDNIRLGEWEIPSREALAQPRANSVDFLPENVRNRTRSGTSAMTPTE